MAQLKSTLTTVSPIWAPKQGIKSFHYLRFLASIKGHVFAESDAAEVDFNLLGSNFLLVARASHTIRTLTNLAVVFIPEYYPQESQDVTCALPLVPEPSTAIANRSTTFASQVYRHPYTRQQHRS